MRSKGTPAIAVSSRRGALSATRDFTHPTKAAPLRRTRISCTSRAGSSRHPGPPAKGNKTPKYVNMADINRSLAAQPVRIRPQESVVDLIELLFFAYRDFVSDPDAILATSNFGRAHHRVLHFVNRNPGLTVADLL